MKVIHGQLIWDERSILESDRERESESYGTSSSLISYWSLRLKTWNFTVSRSGTANNIQKMTNKIKSNNINNNNNNSNTWHEGFLQITSLKSLWKHVFSSLSSQIHQNYSVNTQNPKKSKRNNSIEARIQTITNQLTINRRERYEHLRLWETEEVWEARARMRETRASSGDILLLFLVILLLCGAASTEVLLAAMDFTMMMFDGFLVYRGDWAVAIEGPNRSIFGSFTSLSVWISVANYRVRAIFRASPIRC